MRFRLAVFLLILMFGRAYAQVDSTKGEQPRDRLISVFKDLKGLEQPEVPQVLVKNADLDTLLERFPSLKKLVLHDLIVGSFRLAPSANLERSISDQMAEAAALTPFQAASLAAQRQQVIRGPTPPPSMLGQLNLLGLIEWLRDLLK